MSEQRQTGAEFPASSGAMVGATGVPEVGLPEVDAALAEIGELDERAVDEHVGVFERAQVGLRGALESSADDAR